MITLTRLSGTTFALNSDLIERVDATPDTVVTLVDGKKYVVTDSLDEVVSAVRRHRGEVLALSTFVDLDPWHEPEAKPRLGTVTEHPASQVTRLGRTES
jgi:flagellar protein FlbD